MILQFEKRDGLALHPAEVTEAPLIVGLCSLVSFAGVQNPVSRLILHASYLSASSADGVIPSVARARRGEHAKSLPLF